MFLSRIAGVVLAVALLVSVAPQVHAQSAVVTAAIARLNALIGEVDQIRAELESVRQTLSGAAITSVLGANASVSASAAASASTGSILTLPIEFGETNDDIEKIQKLLATDPKIYPDGIVSGYYGPKTTEAIRNFQTKFGLDSVGVVGPQTKSLLEKFLSAYPDGNYPQDALREVPSGALAVSSQVATLEETLRQVQAAVAAQNGGSSQSTNSSGAVTNNPAQYINAEIDRGEATVAIRYTKGDLKRIVVEGEDEEEVIEAIVRRTSLTKAQVEAVIEFENDDQKRRDDDYDEDDAEEAIEDAEDAIDDAEDEIENADEDGEDVDYAEELLEEAEELLEEAEEALDDEEYDDAVELAKEAKEKAEDAEDAIGEEEDDDNSKKGDKDEVESIEAEIKDEDETEVTVEYEDDDDYVFTIEEDKRDEIIEEIADELNIDEDDVEDLIEFDYGDIDSVDVQIEDGEASVDIRFESGVRLRFVIREDDESDIVKELADLLDLDEDDIEDVIDFD